MIQFFLMLFLKSQEKRQPHISLLKFMNLYRMIENCYFMYRTDVGEQFKLKKIL